MERKIYPENFENFLKKQADEFKMLPSKKVWRGIYNNIKPGARWPSITVSMVFIFALVIVGHLNSNKNYYKYRSNIPLSNSFALQDKNTGDKNKLTSPLNNQDSKFNPGDKDLTSADNLITADNINTNNNDLAANQVTVPSDKTAATDNSVSNNNNENRVETNKTAVPTNENLKDKSESSAGDNLSTALPENDNTVIKNKPVILNLPKTVIEKKQDNQDNKNLTEKQNTLIQRKHSKSSAEFQYFLTPSISYRMVTGNNWDVVHHPMIGFEGGTSIGYKLSKHFVFTTGLQLNYSGYNIKSLNTHPVLSTIVLNNGEQTYSFTGMSQYSNQPTNNNVRLKNYSLQTALPIGLQYIFYDKGDIKLSAATTIQPFFVIKSREYLLTSNGRDYITDPDLLRKWNMSSSFGTYITFKSNSLNWQIGPQVRYQILSSYSNDYQFKEHLIDYGIHVGISRIFK